MKDDKKNLTKDAWEMPDDEFEKYLADSETADPIHTKRKAEEVEEDYEEELTEETQDPKEVDTKEEEAPEEEAGQEDKEEQQEKEETQVAEGKEVTEEQGEPDQKLQENEKIPGISRKLEEPVILKRKGMEYPVEDLDHLTRLAEQGLDYSLKMKDMKEAREKLRLYEDTFGFTPESLAQIKENPKEFARWLVDQFKIDPFDIETSEENPAPQYQRTSADTATQKMNEIFSIVNSLPESETYGKTDTQRILNEYLDKSVKGEYNNSGVVMRALLEDMPPGLSAGFLVQPAAMQALIEDAESGVYAKVYGTMLSRAERLNRSFELMNPQTFATEYTKIKQELYGGKQPGGTAQVPQAEQRQSPPLQNEQRLTVNPGQQETASVKQRLMSDFNDRRAGAKPVSSGKKTPVDYWSDDEAFEKEIEET